MSGRTFGDVASLESYTQRTTATLPALWDAIVAYRRSLGAATRARSDLTIELDDHTSEAEDLVHLLTDIDQIPAAFAFALRELDAGNRRFGGGLGPFAYSDRLAAAIAFARIDHPDAEDHEVRAIAAGERPRRSAVPALRAFFAGAVGTTDPAAGGDAATSVHGRPHPADAPLRWADRTVTGVSGARTAMNSRGSSSRGRAASTHRPGPATPGRRLPKRGSGAVSPAIAGIRQHLADADDHGFTTGDRVARIGATTALDGVGAVIVGAGGAAGGAAIGGVPGGVAGAVAGGEIGGSVGGAVRRTRVPRWLTCQLARGIDIVLRSGHTDDYDDRLDLRPPP